MYIRMYDGVYDAIGAAHLVGKFSLIATKGPHREALIDECHTNGEKAFLLRQCLSYVRSEEKDRNE